jgi:hypothetical protein
MRLVNAPQADGPAHDHPRLEAWREAHLRPELHGEHTTPANNHRLERLKVLHVEVAPGLACESVEPNAVLMPRGRHKDAARAAPSVAEANALLDALFWDGDSLLAARAFATVAPLVDAVPPADSAARQRWLGAAFDVTLWRLANEDAVGVDADMAGLQRLSIDTRTDRVARERMLLVLAAQRAAVARTPDAAQRLATLDSMLELGPEWRSSRASGQPRRGAPFRARWRLGARGTGVVSLATGPVGARPHGQLFHDLRARARTDRRTSRASGGRVALLPPLPRHPRAR